MEYKLRILEEDGGFMVVMDRFEGLSAFGDTPEEALLEFATVLKPWMEVMIEDGETL